MKGDSIVVEAHHVSVATVIVPQLLAELQSSDHRFALSVAGESGSGKSEISAAIAGQLSEQGLQSVILQQDDYFVHPPKSNDAARRADISWVGLQEVHLDLLDSHLGAFLTGDAGVDKPLVDYAADAILDERLEFGDARIAIADGTYTSMLKNLNWRVFIARDYNDTRAHREKRRRDESELDPFIDRVLEIEHAIISGHRVRADFVVNRDYSVSRQTDSGQ